MQKRSQAALVPAREPAPPAFSSASVVEVEPAQPFLSFGDAVEGLWRRKWAVGVAAAVCALAGLAIAFTQAPVYQARALVEVQGLNENFLNRRELDPAAEGGILQFDSYVQTQMRLLQTERLVGKVAERLQLEREPEFQPKAGLLARITGRPAAAATIKSRREALLAGIADRLGVRMAGESRLIEIKFESRSPEVAAAFANGLAEEYVAQNLEKRLSSTRHTATWLAEQLGELKGNLEKAEHELESYLATHDLLGSVDSQKDSVAESRLRQLQASFTSAQEARIVEQARYELIGKAPAAELSSVVDSEAIRGYQSKLSDIRQKLAEARAVYKSGHYRVQQIEAEMAAVEGSIERERHDLMNRLRSQYEASRKREQMVRGDLDTQLGLVRKQSAQEVEYGTLKSSVETYRKLYDSVLRQVKETEVASAIRANNVQVAESATPPSSPVRPSKALYLAGGGLAGLLLGAVAALHRDRNYRLVRAPGEISARLGINELGPIPTAAIDLPFSFGRGPAVLPRIGGLRDAAEGGEDGNLRDWLETVSWRHRESALAESYRSVLASLVHANGSEAPRVVVVTSAYPGEGKTTTATNLAIAMAESGRRVLVIDADRWRPHVHDIFDVPNRRGFSDYLAGRWPLTEAAMAAMISPTEIPELDVLPSGSDHTGMPNLVDNQRAARLIETVRLRYDAVLIDTPPMLALSDARGLGRMSDGVALVISAGRTPEHIVAAASDRLRQDGIHILGSILNNWKPGRGMAGRYYDARYRYAKAPGMES
jgi:polysaccharide biosynthesis transport protein